MSNQTSPDASINAGAELLSALGRAASNNDLSHAGGLNPALDFLMDVPLVVTVELGRRRIPINELLQMGKGSVIELEKVAGEPLDLRVNDRLVARGEAVVVNDKFGVRLTEVVSATERFGELS